MKLLIEGQKISSFDSPPIRLVAGSSEFVPIELQCSSEWDELLVTVQFIQQGKTISKYIGKARTLNVPADISAGWLMITCFGAKTDTEVFGTVNGYETEVYPAGLSSTEQEPIPPTPNLYNQLVAEVKKYADEAQESADKVSEAQETSAQAKAIADKIQENAENGVYNGKDGEQGPPGVQGPIGPTGPQGEKGVSPTVSTEEIVGGTRVDITDVNGSHSFDVMNGIDGAPSEFEVKNIADRVIDGQIKNGFEWDFDKVYLTMTFDDSNSDIDLLEDMAEGIGVPLCFATIPLKLGNTCTNGETVKAVLTRAVKNGGEILSHYGEPLTSASTDEDYQKVYVETKKTLEENGFDVNGIITAGGANYQTQDFAKATEIARIYYQYADLTASNDKTNRQFYNPRKFTDNGLNDVKAYIDGVVANGSGWINLASHGTNNVNTSSVEVFREILEYAKGKGVEIVTWKYLFDNFGKVKNDCAVKSISVNGEKAEADESGNVNLEISSASENWRLIYDETLTDEVQQVYKNKDMSGNLFNLKKLKIYVKSPANTVDAPITINIAGALRVSLAHAITTAVRYSLFTIECDNLACIIDGIMGFNDKTYGMSSGYVKSINFGLTNISDFTVRCNNTETKLLAGTEIKVWGC